MRIETQCVKYYVHYLVESVAKTPVTTFVKCNSVSMNVSSIPVVSGGCLELFVTVQSARVDS